MRKLLRPGPMMVMLFGLAWIAFVIVEIAGDPPDGEASVDSLRDATSNAVHTNDAEALQRLFADSSVGDDYAERFLHNLDPVHRDSIRVEVRGSDIRLASVGGTCLQWPTVRVDTQYLLDAEPVLTRC